MTVPQISGRMTKTSKAPTRGDRENYANDGDAFMASIELIPGEINGIADEIDGVAGAMNEAVTTTINAKNAAESAQAAAVAAISAEAWEPGPTSYTYPEVVAGSDGHTYRCTGTDVVDDNPVGSATGNWEDLTPRLPVTTGHSGHIMGIDESGQYELRPETTELPDTSGHDGKILKISGGNLEWVLEGTGGGELKTSGIDITLTAASAKFQSITFTDLHRKCVLPGTATLGDGGLIFIIYNNAGAEFEVVDNAGTTHAAIGGYQMALCSLSGGEWVISVISKIADISLVLSTLTFLTAAYTTIYDIVQMTDEVTVVAYSAGGTLYLRAVKNVAGTITVGAEYAVETTFVDGHLIRVTDTTFVFYWIKSSTISWIMRNFIDLDTLTITGDGGGNGYYLTGSGFGADRASLARYQSSGFLLIYPLGGGYKLSYFNAVPSISPIYEGTQLSDADGTGQTAIIPLSNGATHAVCTLATTSPYHANFRLVTQVVHHQICTFTSRKCDRVVMAQLNTNQILVVYRETDTQLVFARVIGITDTTEAPTLPGSEKQLSFSRMSEITLAENGPTSAIVGMINIDDFNTPCLQKLSIAGDDVIVDTEKKLIQGAGANLKIAKIDNESVTACFIHSDEGAFAAHLTATVTEEL